MKKILAVLFSLSLILIVFLAAATADDSAPAGLMEINSDQEYGDDPADAEDLYKEGDTIYDLENEVDLEPEPGETPPPVNSGPEDDEADIYNNNSFEAEITAQLSGSEYIADEIIIKFKEPWQVPGKEKQLRHEIEKVEKIGFVEKLGVYVIRSTELARNPQAVLNRYKNNKYIEYVEPNYTLKLDYIPNDPNYKLFQSMPMIALNANAGWDIIKGSSSAIVAVIDSGVTTHADLPPLWSGYSATAGLSYFNDRLAHGTAVAGVIGSIGDNGIGGAGLNWNASIMAVKIDDAAGSLPIANVAKGIIWAADNDAKIINLSLGTTSDSITLKNAIDYAYNKGCAVFAATGNASKNSIDYPARYHNVMAVGSFAGNLRAPTSNYGMGLDVLGLNGYFTTQASGSSGNSAGTSFACPQAAALASLIWGIDPTLTNAQIYDLIRQGASGGGKYINDEMGYGLIDFGKTLILAGGKIPATDNPPPGGIGTILPETQQEIRSAPIITLNGFSELTLEYGQAYNEMGFSAADCKGLDLTSAVQITNNVDIWNAGLYSVTYEVSDTAELSARATRSVTVNPQPAIPAQPLTPKITIIGSDPIVLHSSSNTPYKEQGAKAVDHDGTDISHLVIISGNIKRTTPGTYTITYSITSPLSALTSTTSRQVRIVAPSQKKDPRTGYAFSAQAKAGAKVTHTGIIASALGFMDLTVKSIDKNMTISVELVDASSKKAVFKDTFTAAGTKQYKIDKNKYELVVTIEKANGNSKYELSLMMPETAEIYFFNEEEVPLAGLPQIALRGSNPIILHIGGTPYIEQGARAVDFLGNDISDKVTITGAPNTNVAGSYKITYTVTGAQGIAVSAVREVRVLDPHDKSIILEDEIPLADSPNFGVITHIVISGDNLTSIADKYYGDGKYWRKIYDLNKEVIGNDPNHIYPGQMLIITLD